MSRDHWERTKRISSRYRTRIFRGVERLESRCVLSALPLVHPVVAPVQDIDGYRDLRISNANPGKDVGYADIGGPSHSGDHSTDTSVRSPRGPLDYGASELGYLQPAQSTSEYVRPGYSTPDAGTVQIVTVTPRIVNGFYVMDVAVVTISTPWDNYSSNLVSRPSENRPSMNSVVGFGGVESPSMSGVEYAPSASPRGSARQGGDLTGLAVAPRSTTTDGSSAISAAGSTSATSTIAPASNSAGTALLAGATRAAPLVADRLSVHASETINVIPPWAITGNMPSAAAMAAAQLADLSIMAGRFDRVMIGHAVGGTESIAAAADVPMQKASLVAIPNLAAVEHALATVVNEIEVLGKQLTHWLDDVRLTPMVVAITAAVAGAGATYYVRRRGASEADVLDEEASSSWLFARLQTAAR